MKLARVIGTVVTPVQHKAFDGQRLLAVRPIEPDGTDAADRMFVAIDRVDAGVGDTVLLMAEGSSTRDLLGMGEVPIRCSIVGVIDEIEVAGETLYGPE